ncbi:putative LRR receptor-like serine/threonine-protein kinase-like protein isoform X1 [Tanacetum coccineum]
MPPTTMAKLNSMTRASSSFISIFTSPKKTLHLKPFSHSFSTTKTPFPLQYEMIITQPPSSPPRNHRRPPPPNTTPSDTHLGFDDWVDMKLTQDQNPHQEMDKSKRKYYNKREKRMYGLDDDNGIDGKLKNAKEYVELNQEVVKLKTLHKREEELYFYDAFAYPWEKDKHYKMVYQLEKKFFPDHCFDKAFCEPGESSTKNESVKKGETKDDKGLVFFEEKVVVGDEDVKMDVTEKKVEEFFKCLKKVPDDVDSGMPFVSGRSCGLPPKWDGPNGAVLLVNKPKGWTSFTVCGKLRRLVNVKKVGHAGTLDPMATGLLIVCIGKATKVVDRFQGMVKGYSGVLRLGEATSTLDADSPVIQCEPWEHIKDDDIKKTAATFCGEIWQVPPMFSAIKVGGERLYEKARRGENIELSPRRVSIFRFDVERSLEDRQNVIFRVTCSKGTYIRSLCADFAKALNSCAHMTALRRDSIGEYSVDDAWEFKDLEEQIPKSYM